MAYMRHIREQIEEEYEERHYGEWDRRAEDQRQMIEAVRSKNFEKFRRLMNRGVDSDFTDNFGNSPLHIVVGMPPNIRVSEIMKMLVYFGTSVNRQNRFGLTPLHIASICSAEHVSVLLEAGCAIDMQDNAGRTAVMQVCMSDCKEALTILQYLLDRNANIHTKDSEGLNALHYVCQNHKQDIVIRNEMVYKLLYAGLSSSLRDNRARLALECEVDMLKGKTQLTSKDLQVLQTLIQSGPNIRPKFATSEPWIKLLMKGSHQTLSIIEPTLCLTSTRILLGQVFKSDNGPSSVVQEFQRIGRTVSTLKSKCRIVIRKKLGGEIFIKSMLLGLPKALENYILLSN